MIDLQNETLVTLADLARRLGLGRPTIENWITGRNRNRRTLEAIKIGGRIYTSFEAITRFSEPILANNVPLKKPTSDLRKARKERMAALRAIRDAAREAKARLAEQSQPVKQEGCLLECD